MTPQGRERFRATYAAARVQFRSLAARRGAELTEHVLHGATGPEGEALALDVAWLGPDTPDDAVVVASGTHGIEGYAGSAVQAALLDTFTPPPRCALVLVHGVNPYGMAWHSRVDHRNIDVNRNFLDFPASVPNPGYTELHPVVCPGTWSAAVREHIAATLADYERRHGAQALTQALIGAQSEHPDGMNFTGVESSWSRRAVETALDRVAARRPRRVLAVDLHTGVAPLGEVALLHFPADAADAARALRVWHMDDPAFHFGAQGLARYSGTLVQGLRARYGATWLCAVAEIGTVDRLNIREALRLDRYLRFHADPDAVEYRGRLREVFSPGDPYWMDIAVERGCRLVAHGIAAMASRWDD